MTVKQIIGDEVHVLGTASLTPSDETANFDFGSPSDLYLPGSGFKSGDRVLLVLSAVTDGSTDTIQFAVEDAPSDESGDIDTDDLEDAIIDGTELVDAAGSQAAVVGVRMQTGRPWLRVSVTVTGYEDTIAASVVALGIPQSV